MTTSCCHGMSVNVLLSFGFSIIVRECKSGQLFMMMASSFAMIMVSPTRRIKSTMSCSASGKHIINPIQMHRYQKLERMICGTQPPRCSLKKMSTSNMSADNFAIALRSLRKIFISMSLHKRHGKQPMPWTIFSTKKRGRPGAENLPQNLPQTRNFASSVYAAFPDNIRKHAH